MYARYTLLICRHYNNYCHLNFDTDSVNYLHFIDGKSLLLNSGRMRFLVIYVKASTAFLILKETDEAQVSARRTSVEKTPTHPSEKKQPCGNRRAKTNKYAFEEDIEDWQKQRRKEHQQAIRRQIAKKLTWTK